MSTTRLMLLADPGGLHLAVRRYTIYKALVKQFSGDHDNIWEAPRTPRINTMYRSIESCKTHVHRKKPIGKSHIFRINCYDTKYKLEKQESETEYR